MPYNRSVVILGATMGGFAISISTAIDRLKGNVSFYQPLYEAIANSIEAHAKNINIIFIIENKEGKREIVGYEIIDDGDGFTNDNIQSFLKYMSDYKANIGCKGIGRITWLKVFSKIDIQSQTNDSCVEFTFDTDFSKDAIKIRNVSSSKKITKIVFSNVKVGYQKSCSNVNLQFLKDNVINQFYAKLFLLKLSENNIDIALSFNDSDEVLRVNCDDILDFDSKEFFVNDDPKLKFKLYYRLLDRDKINKNNFAYYCANGRTVKNIDQRLIGSYTNNKFVLNLLLTSDFLDENVNNQRNEFIIIKNSNIGNISFDDINYCLKSAIDEIICDNVPNIAEENERCIKDLIEEYPHLTKYIKQDVSFVKNKKDILYMAKRKFDNEKESVRTKFTKLLNANNVDIKEFDDLVEKINFISANELAEYIVYRSQIINLLKKINEKDGKREDVLHNVFMKIRSQSFQAYPENNLWLLDDKFMTYVYAASDLEVSKIVTAIENSSNEVYRVRYRPDLCLFYSKKSKDDLKEVVIIEFKAADADIDQKGKAFWEIIRNVQIVRENIENVGLIWAYTITKFTDEFKYLISSQDFEPLFSNDSKNEAYYRYYKNANAHCYYLSLNAIIENADARNNIFLDILKN